MEKDMNMPHFIGIEDDAFIRGKVPMTKREIRILTLAAAHIGMYDLVCDIGAGTGSLSIEAAKLAEKGMVYAIEKNPVAVELLRKNKEKFDTPNLFIMEQEAPAGFSKLPERLDAILVGGTGGKTVEILEQLAMRLKPAGRMVLNCITIQSLSEIIAFFRSREDFTYDAVEVQVTRLKQVGRYDMRDAQNPITILTAVKVAETDDVPCNAETSV